MTVVYVLSSFGISPVLRLYMLSDNRKSTVAMFYTVRKLVEVALYCVTCYTYIKVTAASQTQSEL